MDTWAVKLCHEETLSHLKPHSSAYRSLVSPSVLGQFPIALQVARMSTCDYVGMVTITWILYNYSLVVLLVIALLFKPRQELFPNYLPDGNSLCRYLLQYSNGKQLFNILNNKRIQAILSWTRNKRKRKCWTTRICFNGVYISVKTQSGLS